jgi:hypothetical protein
MSAPRIYCIPATRAPVAAVLARGPSDWVRLGRWDLEHDEYEHGAWLAGTVYPQRCDLSPDGRRTSRTRNRLPTKRGVGEKRRDLDYASRS